MKKKHYLLYVFMLMALSCKKEKLEEEKAYLIGTWEWDRTIVSKKIDEFTVINTDTIYASEQTDSYHMVFHEKGVMEYYKNNKRVVKEHLIFEYAHCNYSAFSGLIYCSYIVNSGYRFSYYPGNSPGLRIGSASGSKMFPEFSYGPNNSYVNFFKKVE